MLRLTVIIFIFFALSLLGCTPTLTLSSKELSIKSASEGLVCGSIQIKLLDNAGGKKPFLKSSLCNTKWHLTVKNAKTSWTDNILKNNVFKLTAIAGGEESHFVACQRRSDTAINLAV